VRAQSPAMPLMNAGPLPNKRSRARKESSPKPIKSQSRKATTRDSVLARPSPSVVVVVEGPLEGPGALAAAKQVGVERVHLILEGQHPNGVLSACVPSLC
jgi:hypothetical protein